MEKTAGLPCSATSLAIFGGCGPMSLPCSFDFPGQLAPCARGFSQALLLWATGFPLKYQDPAAGLSESSEFPSS